VQGQVSLGVLQHASPHGSQDGDTSGDGEGHLGRRGTADLDGVAFVCWAAVDFGLIGHAQQCAVGGHVAAAGLPAALSVEAREAWEAWEGCFSSKADAGVGRAGLLWSANADAHQAKGAFVATQGVHQHERCNGCNDNN